MLAEKLGYHLKLIGHAEEKDGKTLAFVAPMAVPSSNPLGRIDDVFNGILVNANMVGEVMFYGPGAGKLPTASAVVADIVDIIAKRDFTPAPLGWQNADDADVADMSDYTCCRMVVCNAKPACDSVSVDGSYAYVTDAMSEIEAKKLKASDGTVAVYRVL
jgi:hypothetical protein